AKLNDRLNPNRHPDSDGGAILRFRQRLTRSHRSFVTVVLRLGSPFTENSSRAADHDGTIIQGRIVHDRAREESVLKRGSVDEWFNRSSGGPSGLQRPVILVVLKIAAADEHEDATGWIIEGDDGPLQIVGRRRHVRAGELLGVAIT